MSSQQFWKRGLLAGAALTGLAVWGVAAGPWSAKAAPEASSVAASAAFADGAIKGVVSVQPFRLAQGYDFAWRAERPFVSAGFLVVLDVDKDAFVPANALEPVLQYGTETVERVNGGHLDGKLIGIVPAVPGADGWPAQGLEGVAPFLAAPALPEQVTAADAQEAWDLAGLAPAAITESAGLDLLDYSDLMRSAGGLIVTHAPGENNIAEGLLMPVLVR